jgi:uncharacterized membrane protein SpoIIM required for sporulation
MRESIFIRQNKEKWQEFERLLDSNSDDPDQLRDLFIQVTDDLSYARTYYPNRSVRVYLNGLAQRIFSRIYKSRRSRKSKFRLFWTDELPRLILESHREFRLSLLVFLLAVTIGVVSSIFEPEFARSILGDDYINMTIENIESGDPMAVYKSRDAFGSALGITAHNMLLAFLTFVMGILFSIGTIGMLISNGVMVGVFQFFFIERGLFWDSFLTIWMHGALEISALVISGAAGLVMGRGLVFPGTLSRRKSFQIASRRGIKIMIGVAPLFVLAGFIEAFVTRYTELPDILRGAFISLCFGYIFFYYYWYPRYKARQGFEVDDIDGELPPDQFDAIVPERIKSGGELFSDVFRFARDRIGSLLGIAGTATLLFGIFIFGINAPRASDIFYFPWDLGGAISQVPTFIKNEASQRLPIVMILLFGWVFVRTYRLIPAPENHTGSPVKTTWKSYILALTGGATVVILLLPNSWLTFLTVIVAVPIVFIWTFLMLREGKWALPSLVTLFRIVPSRIGRVLHLSLIMFLITVFFFLLLDTVIVWFILDFIGMNFQFEQTGMTDLATIMMAVLTVFVLFLSSTVYFIGGWLAYYSLLEIQEADYLRDRIQQIGQQAQLRGLAKEE